MYRLINVAPCGAVMWFDTAMSVMIVISTPSGGMADQGDAEAQSW